MHSMTGFGRGTASDAHASATVEISSVNRKQAEIVVQLPKDLAAVEAPLRKLVLDRVSRGRVMVNVQIERAASEAAPVKIDLARARAVEDAFAQLSKALERAVLPTAADFLRVPDLIAMDESNAPVEIAEPLVIEAATAALEAFLAMRADEGADLARDLETRLGALEAERSAIATLAPGRPERQRDLLFKRLRDLGLELNFDDDRLVKEIALFADRCDISEEITRLDSHFRKFREIMAAGEPAGRPLDFLCQEIHREFNTIGSKAADAAIAQHVVTAKTELEKIREQVQNVE